MALGSRGRRAAQGMALLAGLVASGCRALPVQRLQPAIAGNVGASDATPDDQGPAGRRDPQALPPLPPLEPVSDAEALATRPTIRPDDAVIRAGHEAAPIADASSDTKEPPSGLPDVKTDSDGGDLEPETADEPPTPTASETTEPSSPPEPATCERPAETWQSGIESLRGLAREQARQGGEIGRIWDLRERLLSGMAGSPADDGSPSSWDTVLAAVAESASAAEGLIVPEQATEAPAPEPPLEILDLQLCRKVLSYGDFEPIDAQGLRPGQALVLYCEVAGLRYEPEGDRFRSRLASTVEVWSASGDAPVWSRALGSAADTCRHRRRDVFVNYRLALPPNLQPGPYRLRLTQTDEIAGRIAMRELPFAIRAGD